MSADVLTLPRKEPEGSIEPMLALTAPGMNQVNQVILDRMQSEVPLSDFRIGSTHKHRKMVLV